jgi:hypothetical protein
LIFILFVALIVTKIPFLYLLKWYRVKTVIPTTLMMSCTIIVSITCKEFGVFTPDFASCLIIASSITCILPPIFFANSKKFGFPKEKYIDIIIDPVEAKETTEKEKEEDYGK